MEAKYSSQEGRYLSQPLPAPLFQRWIRNKKFKETKRDNMRKAT
tara:strand:+ start:405 stop:536 length:132 start_codon:yes stop_codon:yes gene_type:complete